MERKTLREPVIDMVRRDMLRACRQLPGQRPGQSLTDGVRCVVEVHVSNECWIVAYGVDHTPPTKGAVVVRAFFQWHAGKRAWELMHWTGCKRMFLVNGVETDELPEGVAVFEYRDEPFTDECYLQWGGEYTLRGDDERTSVDVASR